MAHGIRMAYSYLSYEGDVFCLTGPWVLVVRHMLSELTSLFIMPKDYQLLNFFKLFFLLIFSLNTASQIVRKYGKKNVIEDPEYLKRSGKSTNYNLIQFDNSSDLTQVCWRLQGFSIKKIPH